jgi:hypothetical protein
MLKRAWPVACLKWSSFAMLLVVIIHEYHFKLGYLPKCAISSICREG